MAKLSTENKVKLIYSGELMIFAIVFLVLGVLKLMGIMPYNEGRRVWFNYLTTAGGIWLITDLIWALVSKKRQKRICLLDKFLNVPLGVYLLIFNIICFTQAKRNDEFYVVMMCFAFFYVGCDYLFQSIYHWYNPLPNLMEEAQKIDEEIAKEEAKENEEKKEDSLKSCDNVSVEENKDE